MTPPRHTRTLRKVPLKYIQKLFIVSKSMATIKTLIALQLLKNRKVVLILVSGPFVDVREAVELDLNQIRGQRGA
jgi:hypothetical protein